MTTTDNLFEIATRKKFRFETGKGDLTVEQLWDLPLTTTVATKIDLDSVARTVNAGLKSVTEESFVAIKPDPRKGELEAKLEIVKHVIAAKLKENEDKRAAAERSERRRLILDAIAARETQELSSASKEDLLKQLAEIDG
jgi:hypothetical protein